MTSLLIYIPSFNRYDLLVNQIDNLILSIENDHIFKVKIFVNDNASTDKRYKSLLHKYPQDYVTINRNNINIGLVGNLINGFMQINWDYIWLLSDDDIVQLDALKTIITEISKSEYDIIHLKCGVKGDDRLMDGEILTDKIDFFSRFSLLSMMGFMSSNIYSNNITKYVQEMYLYGYTLFPFVAGIIKIVTCNQFKLKCIGGNLISWRMENRSYSEIYEMAIINSLFLQELITKKKERIIFLRRFIKDWGVSHYFSFATKNLYNFKKALAQVGFFNLFLVFCLFFRSKIKYIIKEYWL